METPPAPGLGAVPRLASGHPELAGVIPSCRCGGPSGASARTLAACVRRLPVPKARRVRKKALADRGAGGFLIGTSRRSTDRVLMDHRSQSRRLFVLAGVTMVVALEL